MSEPWRPVKVMVIDLEECPEAVSSAPSYSALWALVRESRRPRGFIRLPFSGPELRRADLEAAIATLPPVSNPPSLRPEPGERLPRVSVVIPSLLERRESLAACLRSMAALDYPDYEVIVVDNRPNGSPPVALPLEPSGVRLAREPYRGISAARNRGLREADGEIVAFTDDDVEVDPAWLLAIALRMWRHPEEVCVTGLLMPRELETPAQQALEDYYGGLGPRALEPVSHRLRERPGRGAHLRPATVEAIGDDGRCLRSFSLYAAGSFGPGANMAFRTETLREFGGFDVRLGAGTSACGGEDLVIFARTVWAGFALGFEPAAIVHHNHYADEAGLRRQIEGYGTSWGALLLALAADDHRHLLRMLATVPRGLAELGSNYHRKLDHERSSPIMAELAKLELRGIAQAPAAYLRTHRASHR